MEAEDGNPAPIASSRGVWKVAGLAGLGGMLVGYWAPWRDGHSAGLTFSGFDLVPFLVFFQRAGYGPLLRERMWIPLWGLALALALLALAEPGKSLRHGRSLLWILAGLWPLATWPPYPDLLNPLSIEGRGGFLGGMLTMLLVGSLPLWPPSWRRRLALALPWAMLGGVGPELVQVWSLWARHLGLAPAIGWGLPLYGLGLALWEAAWWRTSS